ncbi:MAG: hypothetical protein DMF00_13030 [Verrucomicrobia bacterium]|nr:MAG: hypothetical protein DMF00_13030 [Verrucomicrobiota bacterium]
MKMRQSLAGPLGLAMLLCTASGSFAQSAPEVRRARPVDEPPVPRALPADESIDRVLRSLKEDSSEAPAREPEGADRRQLDYANGLFTRKLYDLAIPEYQKYLDDYPGRPGRANAYFSLGECYRNLNRLSNARTNFQKVLNDYGDSEFAGAAAYALAETAFTEKDYAAALPLFHRAAAKSKEPAVALSARYFEARCLEATGRKEEAANIYVQVAETGNPNPYREDARWTAASILAGRGKSHWNLFSLKKVKSTRPWPIELLLYCRRVVLFLKLENSARSHKSVCADCNTKRANTHSCWPITKKSRRSFLRRRKPRCCCSPQTASGNSEIQRKLTHFIARLSQSFPTGRKQRTLPTSG